MITKSGTMLQRLVERERPLVDGLIKLQVTLGHERQRDAREPRLRVPPPWHRYVGLSMDGIFLDKSVDDLRWRHCS